MSGKADADAKLRRLGRTAYKEIVVPRKRAPVPSRFEGQRNPNTQTFEGIEFAREPLSAREFKNTIAARSRVTALQHIVARKEDEAPEVGRPLGPWRYRVVARCKAKLRRAAVKVGRQFLELQVCPKCWKTLPKDG